MSGALAAAAIASAVVAGGSLAYGVYNGQKQDENQETALKKQNTAQDTATTAALSTERNGEIAEGAANQKTPDITSILQRAASWGTGASSTMLTGPGGAAPPGSNLGKATLLGS